MGMLASLIAGLASGETAAAIRRARVAFVVYLFAGAAALCGVGFLIAAGYIAAARHFGPMAAALGFGFGFILIALLILLVFLLSSGRRKAHQAKRRQADMAAIGITTALTVLPTLLRGKAGVGALLAPAIAAAAYAIYKENSKPSDTGPDEAP